ncbi:MGMT family protein [Austwickia chelonae]|uniref:MGMT family protein n=1 Tax=Austwickia chelonae TaxID=100225 RepID=UPI001F07961B|nr:MGMT family protein [Austwickia chelonae]
MSTRRSRQKGRDRPLTNDLLIEHVLAAVEQIPPGRVASYGDIADLVGTGPRQVGRIMRTWGAGVPWWRVTTTRGELAAPLRAAARVRWAEEGIVWRADGRGCSIADVRISRAELSAAYAVASSSLPPYRRSG